MLCVYCGEKLIGNQTKFCGLKCKNNWSVAEWRRRSKVKAVALKGGKCTRCGYDRCVAALQLHHEDSDKVFHLGDGKGRKWEKIEAELAKCVLICNNCHAEEHWLSDEQLMEKRHKRAASKI